MEQPILEVEHLKKSYVNNVPILDDVSFSMQKGEVVVIVGPSGCGKSTFLRCINRLEAIDSGVLKLNLHRTLCIQQYRNHQYHHS